MQRTLTPEIECRIGMLRLCGVAAEAVTEEAGVSTHTVYNIFHNRRHEWMNPLADIYVQEPRHARNGAHLLLADRGIEVPDAALARGHEHLARDVQRIVYDPLLGEVADRTGLEAYLVPSTGEEQLLVDLFAMNTIQEVIEPFLYRNVETLYREEGPYRLGEVSDLTTADLIQWIKAGALAMTPGKRQLIDEAMRSTLAPRDIYFIQDRYGFFGTAKTLDAVGATLNLTREYVRQRITACHDSLRAVPPLRFLSAYPTPDELLWYDERQNVELVRDELRKELVPAVIAELRDTNLDDLLEFSKLEFNTRARSTLATLGVNSIGGLRTLTGRQLLKTTNTGKKTVDHIRSVLAEIGIAMPE